ncbi:uncharacterized protein TM35_001001020 [Trypanosoma theileri]|uniref:Uncharacterized protein n=1 Tax=Trypanosoma theileri TaxID=67003 RepID=A0A1X0NG27_9TRYP|nr:uncharacterized protein TM35_001001020 [Trypanosoma theileri]ORC82030.1 hypothetical protein TM35_001001020 [Trypanosoma theileri]
MVDPILAVNRILLALSLQKNPMPIVKKISLKMHQLPPTRIVRKVLTMQATVVLYRFKEVQTKNLNLRMALHPILMRNQSPPSPPPQQQHFLLSLQTTRRVI